jgi:hypothetical protein
MRFALRQLMVGISVAAIWLAIACWHPMLAFVIAFLSAFPATIALFSRHRSMIVFGAVAASVVIGFFWIRSHDTLLSIEWGPSRVVYQVISRRGKLHLFRYVRSSGGNQRLIIFADEPGTKHWSDWPGFHEERFLVRVPGLEWARSKYLVPIGVRPAVDYAEVLTLSYWLIQTVYLTLALSFAIWAGHGSRPANS